MQFICRVLDGLDSDLEGLIALRGRVGQRRLIVHRHADDIERHRALALWRVNERGIAVHPVPHGHAERRRRRRPWSGPTG